MSHEILSSFVVKSHCSVWFMTLPVKDLVYYPVWKTDCIRVCRRTIICFYFSPL